MKKTILLATCALATLSARMNPAELAVFTEAENKAYLTIETVVNTQIGLMREQAFAARQEITREFDARVENISQKIEELRHQQLYPLDRERYRLEAVREEMINQYAKIEEEKIGYLRSQNFDGHLADRINAIRGPLEAEKVALLKDYDKETASRKEELNSEIAKLEEAENRLQRERSDISAAAELAVDDAMPGKYEMFNQIRQGHLLLGIMWQ